MRPTQRFLQGLMALCIGSMPWTLPAGAAEKPATASDPRSAWQGKWIGPEGAYLQLTRQGGYYKIVIQSLDNRRSFKGRAIGKDRIQFERDGKELQLRAGNGKSTGMKWLADKERCLIVEPGEGYCR